MGDISLRGRGKALKMKKGGALPSTRGSSKAGMQSKQGRNFLLPDEKKQRTNVKKLDPMKFDLDKTKIKIENMLRKMGLDEKNSKKVFERVRKIKPSGRINVDDVKRVINSMNKTTAPNLMNRMAAPKN
jgi:hypothetical protein|tara:strand:- start:1349 stop:1735 length:387 start_codon:yes stop_codon:yes gene_type:complete